MSDEKITPDQALCERLAIAALQVEDEGIRSVLYALELLVRTGESLAPLASPARKILKAHREAVKADGKEPDYLSPVREVDYADRVFGEAETFARFAEEERAKLPAERRLWRTLTEAYSEPGPGLTLEWFAGTVERWPGIGVAQPLDRAELTRWIGEFTGEITPELLVRHALRACKVDERQIEKALRSWRERKRGR